MFVSALLLALTCLAAPETGSAPGPLAPPRHGGIYVMAHRGAHQGIPENTLAAYRRAIDLGADFVEIDVRTTKDGHYVSVHNASVDQYARGAAGRVADMTLAELRALDIGSRVGPQWKDERIPTFEEILDLCQGRIGIYLDLKDAPVAALIPLVRARGMERHVFWYAEPDELDQVKAQCAECIPMPDPGPEAGLPPLLERFHPEVVATVWEHHTRSLVDACHAAHALVIPDEDGATVAADLQAGRTPQCWQDAVDRGSDGIQTDWPEELIAFLDGRGRAKP